MGLDTTAKASGTRKDGTDAGSAEIRASGGRKMAQVLSDTIFFNDRDERAFKSFITAFGEQTASDTFSFRLEMKEDGALTLNDLRLR